MKRPLFKSNKDDFQCERCPFLLCKDGEHYLKALCEMQDLKKENKIKPIDGDIEMLHEKYFYIIKIKNEFQIISASSFDMLSFQKILNELKGTDIKVLEPYENVAFETADEAKKYLKIINQ